MKTNYDNMKKIADMLTTVVMSQSGTNDSLRRNQQAITAEIASLENRYGNKFGDDESQQVDEIKTRNDGITLKTDQEIKLSEESTLKEWQEKVLSLDWTDDGAAQMEAA